MRSRAGLGGAVRGSGQPCVLAAVAGESISSGSCARGRVETADAGDLAVGLADVVALTNTAAVLAEGGLSNSDAARSGQRSSKRRVGASRTPACPTRRGRSSGSRGRRGSQPKRVANGKMPLFTHAGLRPGSAPNHACGPLAPKLPPTTTETQAAHGKMPDLKWRAERSHVPTHDRRD